MGIGGMLSQADHEFHRVLSSQCTRDTFKVSTNILSHMVSNNVTIDDGIERFTGPDVLPVFVEGREELTFRLLPRFDTGRIQWAIQIVPPGMEHPEYESSDGITDAAVEAFDLSAAEQERLNRVRKFARRNIDLGPVLANRTRTEFALTDLETVMGEWTP